MEGQTDVGREGAWSVGQAPRTGLPGERSLTGSSRPPQGLTLRSPTLQEGERGRGRRRCTAPGVDSGRSDLQGSKWPQRTPPTQISRSLNTNQKSLVYFSERFWGRCRNHVSKNSGD